MMKKLLIIAALSLSSLGFGLATADRASAAPLPLQTVAATCPSGNLLGFQPWYNGLECGGTNGDEPQLSAITDIWVIVLNVMQWLIVAAGYVSLGFIIWGGFRYMKSQGEPGELSAAKNTILEACIGLGIVLASTAIVQFVIARIG